MLSGCKRILRPVSAIVLFFFTWTFGGIFDIAHAAKSGINGQVASGKVNTQKTKEQSSAEKFQKTIEGIEQIISGMRDKSEAEVNVDKGKLKTKKSEIETIDIEIKKQFAETEKKLKDEGLPSEILDRHYKFVRHYEDNLKELKKNLDAIDKAKNRKEVEAKVEETKEFLEKVNPPKKHIPLDPDKLPHRSAEPVFIEPRTTPEEFKTEDIAQNKERRQKSVLIASNGSLSGLLSQTSTLYAQSSNPPTSADLAQTIEVQFTPAIQAKAAELGHNPVKIYNWARNNIEYAPTYGSIQGADMCLQTKQCNDFDTASLLIALLRASGIYARYVYGTIELPIEKVMNWVGGFTDPMASLRLIAAGGTPVASVVSGGRIVTARMEHVWVEAYVDMIPSQGGVHKQGDTWVPLDASFKQYGYTQGIDIKTAVPFNAQAFIDQIQATATINETEGYVTNVSSLFIQQTMTDYQTQVQNYITQNYPNATVGDVLGKKDIVKQEFPVLLGTLPYKMVVKGATYSGIPDNLRHKITFSVIKDIYDDLGGTPIDIIKSLPELAGKKITLSYSPATQADENVINKYLPKPHTDGTPIQPSELPTSLPAYLINVKPELRVDGTVVATGTVVGLGQDETLGLTFSAPNKSSEKIEHFVKSGEYFGIAIDQGRISADQMQKLKTKLEATKAKLEAQDFTTLAKDDILGDLLYTTALSYFAELDMMNYVQSKTMGVESIRLPSESAFSLKLNTYSVFGIPQSVSAEGLAMDVARNLSAREALNGDKGKKVQFVMSAGMTSSALEHSVPEQLFSTPENPAHGVSAVKALQLANEQGIPIYTINQSNIAATLPQLQVDADVKADIQNAVNAGKEVTVSKTNINYNGWTGYGYIVIDPTTGEGAYMISGGMNGAYLLKAITWMIATIISAYTGINLSFWGGLVATLFTGSISAFIQKLIDQTSAINFKDVVLFLTSVIAWTSVASAFAPLIAAGPAGWIAFALITLSVALLDLVITYSFRMMDFFFVHTFRNGEGEGT